MKGLLSTLLVPMLLATSCMKDSISLNVKGIVQENPIPTTIPTPPSTLPLSVPAAPAAIAIASVPTTLSATAVFTISEDPAATVTEARIYRASDDSLVLDWTPIASGGNISGVSLDEGTPYYAVFRSKNDAGTSPEVTSDEWIPVSNSCEGARLTNSPYASGTGTDADPYLICTQTQFLQIAANTSHFSSTFKLMADIDLNGATFEGIGSTFFPFQGKFLGNDKAIKNIAFSSGTSSAVGLFNQLTNAFIYDLNIIDPVINAFLTTSVGIVSGVCSKSYLYNISVNNASLTGSSQVGMFSGTSAGCSFLKLVGSGTVVGEASVGGIVGQSSDSTIANVISTIVVNSPSAVSVGGVIGSVYSDSYIQGAFVTGSVTGLNDVGGLVGTASWTKININRSSFNASISGNQNVGGIFGQNSSEGITSMVSSNVVLNGMSQLGGAVGLNFSNYTYKNLRIDATITSSGATQTAVGGFYGSIGTMPNTINSLSVVTINGDANKVGGFSGESTDMSFMSFTTSNNAVYGTIEGSDANELVSLFSGSADGAFDGTSSYYGGTCNNKGLGNCNTNEGNYVSNQTDFYDGDFTPYLAWDFSRIWQFNMGTYPTLKLAQSSGVTFSTTCSSDAFAGIPYVCNLTVDSLEDDAEEFQTIAYDKSNTCSWLQGHPYTLKGTPSAANSETCTLAYRISDGLNDHPAVARTSTINVHKELSISPSYTYQKGYWLKQREVGTGVNNQTFTITNTTATPITGLSFSGLGTGEFTRTGGTCGASIAANASCTIIITFNPSWTGEFEDVIGIIYDKAGTPLTLTYKIYGTGT